MIAKRGGDGSHLLPPGVHSVIDMPADLVLAIDHGYKILNWQENLTDEEMPPKWMWPLDWELEIWFEEISALRKAKYGGEVDDRDEAPMMKNEDPEIAKRFER